MPKLVALWAIGWVSVLAATGCSQFAPTQTSTTASSKDRLPIESQIDFGVISQGQSTRFNHWIRNCSDSEVDIAEIEKSCECLTCVIPQSTLKPQEKGIIHLTYDGTKEPEFMGVLQLEVKLKNTNGKIVGKIEVPIEIVSARDIPEARGNCP